MKLFKSCMAAVCMLALAACSPANKEAKDTAAEAQSTEQQVDKPEAVTVLAKGAVIPTDEKLLTVIDFNATWCGPCRQFAPIFHKVAEEYTGRARFYSVDTDEHPQLAALYEVTGIPTVVYLKPDGSYTTTVGLLSEEEFKQALETAIK